MTRTGSQQARQERMLDVASRLATDGGFDGVQMRLVASEADVALGTLYRYFPSKEHLLVSAMLRQIGALGERLTVRPPQGSSARDRVDDVLGRATRALQRQPQFTKAVVRALVSGEPSLVPVVRQVRDEMNRIVLGAAGGAEPTEHDVLVADLLSEIWLSALVSWISGVATADSVVDRLRSATALLLPS